MKQDNEANWVGLWKNQYGSQLTIESAANGHVQGSFRSAVDTHFKDAVPVAGTCGGRLIAFTTMAAGGRKVVAYTGVLQDGRIQTLWHVAVSEKLTAEAEGPAAKMTPTGLWEAFITGADLFERVQKS